MGSYKLTVDAKADLKRIYHHGVHRYSEVQADNYFDGLHKRFDEIAEKPFHCQKVPEIREGYRRSPYGSDNIYYRVIEGAIEIVSIIGRQDIKKWIRENN